MNDSPSIKKNFILKTLYQMLLIIAPLISSPYVARVLGADGVGIYSYVSSYMIYFTLFASLGTSSYGQREIARNRDNKEEVSKLFWEIKILNIFTTIICLFCWISLIVFSNTRYKLYMVALIPQLFTCIFDIDWFYEGYEKINYQVKWGIILKLLWLFVLFMFVKSKANLMFYMVALTSTDMFSKLSQWLYLKTIIVRINPKSINPFRHIKKLLIYFIPTVAATIYTVLDRTLIGLLTQSEYENGYYEQAANIIEIGKMVSFTTINDVLSARMSYLFGYKNKDEVKERLDMSMSIILLLGFGSMFGIAGISNSFVPVFFGSGYEPVIMLLKIMTPLIIFIGISNCLGYQYYTPSGRISSSTKCIIIGSIVNLIMNMVLIPHFNSIGAAIGSIVAEGVIALLYILNSHKYMTIKKIFKISYKKIAAGSIMFLIIYFLGKISSISLYLILLIQLIVGGILYLVILILFKDDTMILIKNMLAHEIYSRVKKEDENDD